MNTNTTKTVLKAVVMLVILQAIREVAELFIKPYIPHTVFADKMLTMSLMITLSVAVIIFAKHRKEDLSVFPQKFSKAYIIITAVAAALLIAAPSNYTEGLNAIMTLIYGSIVTPVYEELVFRGYIWNKLQKKLKGKYSTYIATTVLFGVWHLGYMLPQIIAGNAFAVTSKLAVGLVYGAVLGIVRLKTKNCYSAIVLHGVMNLFAF